MNWKKLRWIRRERKKEDNECNKMGGRIMTNQRDPELETIHLQVPRSHGIPLW
jgi:hypothetical protein